MALDLGAHIFSLNDQLRYHPISKRIRASRRGSPVLDTTHAFVVWEPGRVVPMYAVPPDDVAATLTPCPTPPMPDGLPPVLGPVTFGWHRHDGESFTVEVGDEAFEASAFRPSDPALEGRVIVEWAPFEWMEESTPVTGHPHDPFKRIDVLPSDRHVVVSFKGAVLADSSRAIALYETHLPTRWYIPREDVRTDLLVESETTSICAYKGHANYLSVRGSAPESQGADLAWTYLDPLPEVAIVKGHVTFYNELIDLALDGVDLPRPITPWSSRRGRKLF